MLNIPKTKQSIPKRYPTSLSFIPLSTNAEAKNASKKDEYVAPMKLNNRAKNECLLINKE